MDPSMNITDLTQINFPVFRLGTNKPEIHDGIIYYYYVGESTEDEDGEVIDAVDIRIVDDTHAPGATFALRRLRMKMDGTKLHRLRNASFFLGDFIKLAKPTVWFIDSNGKLFNYRKSTRAKLKFYPLKEVIAMDTGGAIIEAVGIPTRFKVLYVPDVEQTHVGILHLNKSLIFYGFYDKQYDETWRLV